MDFLVVDLGLVAGFLVAAFLAVVVLVVVFLVVDLVAGFLAAVALAVDLADLAGAFLAVPLVSFTPAALAI